MLPIAIADMLHNRETLECLNGSEQGKATLVGALGGALVGTLVGPLVDPLVGPLVGPPSLKTSLNMEVRPFS